MPNSSQRQTMANAIRALAIDAVQAAKSGHPGMPMGMADAATALFCDHLKFDPTSPDWPDRDRFVLSAGHGSMLIYALLHLTGYEDMTIDQIRNFRQLGARTAGHPEFGQAKGIETTTGPLGQGLANAVGMAMAERHMAARYGDDLVDHRTYVIAGDGCLMEGVSHEAASMAGHMRLGRLIVLFDETVSRLTAAPIYQHLTIPLRGSKLWMSSSELRRARYGCCFSRYYRGENRPAAEHDMLQNHYWLWRTKQTRHIGRAWSSTRRC